MAKKATITNVNPNDTIFNEICSAVLDSLNVFCNKICSCNCGNDKKNCISDLQTSICNRLNSKTSSPVWHKEYKKPHASERDRLDIYGQSKSCHWILEIDTTRADQVGKKAFSRFALYGTGNKSLPFFYVAIIYPGTDYMNLNEVIKYSRYGYDIAKKMDKRNEFRTIIIDCKENCIKVLRFDKHPKFTVKNTAKKAVKSQTESILKGKEEYSMRQAVKKAIELYFERKGNNYEKLEEALKNDEEIKNHNGQQTIISKLKPKKDNNTIQMQDKNGTIFFLTGEWMYNGAKANFDGIIRFFNDHKILIQHAMEKHVSKNDV